MKLIVVKNYEEMSKKASEIMIDVVNKKSDAILGLATGSTPIGLYKYMIQACKNGEVSFANTRTVNLDEYIGLPKSHSESYFSFMHNNLFNHIDIDKKNVNLPDGEAIDMNAECDRYNTLLDSMPQDIQLLGIGANGHIGFNEPYTEFDSVTHIVDLEQKTRNDNARFFDSIDQVPEKAVTMGISNIMKAKKVLILASGDNKKDAVYAMLVKEVSKECPASVLMNHANAIAVIDESAASLLNEEIIKKFA